MIGTMPAAVSRGEMGLHLTPPISACHDQDACMLNDSCGQAVLWRAEMMRLTAFPASRPQPTGAAHGADRWWAGLFGAAPERSTRDLTSGVTQVQGTVDDAVMVAVENPVSFDLKRLASDPAQPPVEVEAMPQFSEVVGGFEELVGSWLALDDCPSLRRLAFGATLLFPVANAENGYITLNRYLPQVEIDPRSSDFLYQINRVRQSSAIPGLSLNRLARWTVRVVQSLAFSSDGAAVSGSPTFACQLELDVNTDPSTQLLPRDPLRPLFSELVKLADEIALQGDLR